MGTRGNSIITLLSNPAHEGSLDDDRPPPDFSEAPEEAVLQPKDPRTKYKYNFCCRFFLFWLDPLFWVGFRRSLDQTDLYAHPSEADSEKLLKKFNKYWEEELRRKERGRKARLWVAIYKCLWWRVLLQGVLLFLEIIALVCQSVVLGYLSDYFSLGDPTPEDTRDAYLYAAALFLLSLVVTVTLGHGFLTAQKVGMMARIIATSAIYQKVLTLSQVTIGQISIGHVVNLASNDVQRFDLAFLLVHCTWIAPLHLVVFTYLVYLEVGWSAFLATGFVFLQIPLQICLARLFAHLRFKSARVTDQRVQIMNEVISGIRVIKMYAWEYAFKKIITKLRRRESSIIFQAALIRACNLGFMIVSVTVIMWLVFTVYVTTGGTLTPKKVFTTLSLVTFLRLTSIHFVILNFLGMSEGRVALKRIQDLLELEELPESTGEHEDIKVCTEDSEHTDSKQKAANCKEMKRQSRISLKELLGSFMFSPPDSPPTTPPASPPPVESLSVKVDGISASWSYEREKLVLGNISFEVNKGTSLLAVVGPVGAGKSTLLQCLLGELKPMDGSIEVKGRVLYASQEPWVFSGTLRENILFGQPYQSDWYNTVVEACALDKDIAKLCSGDLTMVGERGVTLSGGQKARVNLARAVYRDADVYLLDDPLSAVDTAVAMHLFENCIRVLLANRLVILVTHQVQFALQADKILVLKDGKVEAYGKESELLSQGVNPAHLLGLLKSAQEEDEFAYSEDKDSDDDDIEEEMEEDVFEDLVDALPSPFQSPIPQRKLRPKLPFHLPSPLLVQTPTRTPTPLTSPPLTPCPLKRPSPFSPRKYSEDKVLDDDIEEEMEEDVFEDMVDPVILAPPSPFQSPIPQRKLRPKLPFHLPSPLLVQSPTRTPTPLTSPPLTPRPLQPSSPFSPRKFPPSLLVRRMSLQSLSSHRPRRFVRTGGRMSLRQPSSLPPHMFPAVHRHMSLRSSISNPYPNVPLRRQFSIYSSASMSSLLHVPAVGQEDEEEVKSPSTSEEKAQGRISMATYYRYFRAGGNYLLLTALLIVFLMGEVSIVMSDWWLSDWADCSTTNVTLLGNRTLRSSCLLSTNQRIGIYTGTTVAAILINFTRTITFYFVCVNASRVLHNRMFAAILRAPMLFFDTNPIGRVLNRFSKDVGFLDDLLPYVFCEYLLLLLRCLAIMAVAVAINVWVIIPAVLLLAVFLAVRWYYLKTSRDIKRLEAVARSPLYSHISTTLQGLPTIRTFGKQAVALDHFHKYQNEHTQGWYLYLATIRWFGMRLDTLSSLFLATVAFISIPLASQLNAGLVGLGLTYTISLAGMFQYCVRQSAEVENIMISAERIMDYGRLESEAPLETIPAHKKPPPEWPERGEIVLEDVSFSYSSHLPLVLKFLTIHIKPSEKVGIVGRTGAGKSSLLAMLFRMAEHFGAITIDGINTNEIGLHDLRRKMSIIPQDPVLFSGTMRYNLDPFGDFSDAALWDVLEQVQLKPVVQQLEGQLDGEVSEGGANFSVGQRQLVCLARALLQKNRILVLDEATANIDMMTDAIIQETIREKFSECTVLTIAHRLNTVMDSDRILVLNRGHVKEFDTPHKLLQDPHSQLWRMVEKTGASASVKLHRLALDGHQRQSRKDSNGVARESITVSITFDDD